MTQFFQNVPVWVWPLFILLVVVGLRSTRNRVSPLWLFYLLPLLGLLGVRNLIGLPFTMLNWPVWGAAFVLGSGLGYKLQGKWVIEKLNKTVRVSGEWLTFSMTMVLFLSNFVLGVVKGVSPQTLLNPVFLLLYLTAIGIASGTFLGRSVKILRL